MCKLVVGQLIQTVDESRVDLEAHAKSEILEEFDQIAKKHNSYRNYVIEHGLNNLLAKGDLYFNRKQRPKDRMRYLTFYDKELVEYHLS